MLAEITAAVQCVTAIKDLAKLLQTGPKDAQWREHVTALVDNIIDLQSRMLAVQAECFTCAEANTQLTRKLAEQDEWREIASRYELSAIAPEMFAYRLKQQHTTGEPAHWLCPICFSQRQRSVLTKVSVDAVNHRCYKCGFDICPQSAYF
jgi:hypothetical protein